MWLLSTTATRSDCEISRDCGKIAIYVQATFEVAISIGEISYADASFSLFRKILSILVPSSFFFFQAIRFEIELRNDRSLI